MADAEKVAHLFFDSAERHFQFMSFADDEISAAERAGEPDARSDSLEDEGEGENDVSYFRWSADRDRELRDMVDRGIKKVDIACHFGVNIRKIWSRCQALGISKKLFPWDEAKGQELQRMHEAGKSAIEIAKWFGITPKAVRCYASRMGLKFGKSRVRWAPEKK